MMPENIEEILREEYRKWAKSRYYSDSESESDKTCRAIFGGALGAVGAIATRLGIDYSSWDNGIKEEAEADIACK